MQHAFESETRLDVAPVSTAALAGIAPALVDLLVDNVNAGASLGYLAPLKRDEAQQYWLSLRTELASGARLLLVARCAGHILGTGQLMLPQWPMARHRADLQKLLVAPAWKGRGIGHLLVAALHDAARHQGRTLLTLNTRSGEPPEQFYKKQGYREAGVIPGYTRGAAGLRHDSVMLWQELSA